MGVGFAWLLAYISERKMSVSKVGRRYCMLFFPEPLNSDVGSADERRASSL
jgi:hypothetical protein